MIWGWMHIVILCKMSISPPSCRVASIGVCGTNSQGTPVCMLSRRGRRCPARGSRLASADAARRANVLHSTPGAAGPIPARLCAQLSRQQPSSTGLAPRLLQHGVHCGADLHILVKALPVPLLEEAEGDAFACDARPQAVERLAALLPGRTPPTSGRAVPSPSRSGRRPHNILDLSLACVLGSAHCACNLQSKQQP